MLSQSAGTGLSATRRYRFDDVEIDLDAREIRRAGQRADVEAKVFDLIELLLLAGGRALSKTELTSALWADRPVTDAALSQQLRKARRALGDDGETQRVIRTVHGRGLRWVAEVAEVADTPAENESIAAAPAEAPRPDPAHDAVVVRAPARSRRRRWLASAAIGLIVLAVAAIALRFPIRAAGEASALPRIAVLPFDDNTGEADLGWTRNGLMGLMASLFEQAGGVEVVSAQNVRAAIGGDRNPVDLDVLRRALGATHFVAGTLRRVGPLYELDLHLIGAGAAERHEVLHGSTPAPLAVDAVARVRRWLDLAPLPDTRASGIESAFLAEAYARGIDAQLHGDHAGAKKYFEICLDHDPGLAWPRLGLAVSQSASGEDAEADRNAENVVAAARERNDRDLLVPALRQRAASAYRRGDLDTAKTYLDEALAGVSADDQPLTLSELLVGYASIEDEHGDVAAARTHFDEALRLARKVGSRRAEANALINMASLDNGAGDAAAAAARLREGLDAARAAGDAYLEGTILGNLGATEANQGRLLDAIALLKQGFALAFARGDTRMQALIGTQLVWALLPFDRDADARALAERIAALGEKENNDYWQAEAHWTLAALFARQHAWQAAFDEFEHARSIYAAQGMTRSLAPMLVELAAAADAAGDAAMTRDTIAAFRTVAGESAELQSWQPLLDAHLRHASGDAPGAVAALDHLLDTTPTQQGPVAQAALFQLGRWQLEIGRADAVLSRSAWKPLLDGNPDAIALRIEALRATGEIEAADAEQKRLDALRHATELDIDQAWLARD